ncbi:MAG: hypothetical protein QW520_06885, partial [Methanomassiliicoccales archaeon]
VNKIGTRSLALACRESGISCNIVAAENKILPFNCVDPLRSSSKIKEVQFEKQVFEVTPFSLFNTWFSNKGFYTSDKIIDSIKNLRIAEILNRKKNNYKN